MVCGSGAANPVGLGGTPNSVVLVGIPNPVGLVRTPNAVVLVGTPNAVDPIGTPNPVDLVGTLTNTILIVRLGRLGSSPSAAVSNIVSKICSSSHLHSYDRLIYLYYHVLAIPSSCSKVLRSTEIVILLFYIYIENKIPEKWALAPLLFVFRK